MLVGCQTGHPPSNNATYSVIVKGPWEDCQLGGECARRGLNGLCRLQ